MQHRVQRIVIAVNIDHNDGFAVHAQLRLGRHFEKFIEGAKPTRQHHKGIRHLQHQRLALLDMRGDDQFFLRTDWRLQALQKGGDDALHRRAAVLGGQGDIAHQAQAAAPEHQRKSQPGNAGAQRARRLAKPGVRPKRGAAKDADGGLLIVHNACGVARAAASS